MNSELIVSCNMAVSIRSILQRLTYGGLLEGLPTKELNSRILKRVVTEAKSISNTQAVYLIEPQQQPIKIDRPYPFGEPFSLPSVYCIVEVSSFNTYRDKTKSGSSLILVWFQSDFIFPVEEDILEKIKNIPYERLCEEYDH